MSSFRLPPGKTPQSALSPSNVCSLPSCVIHGCSCFAINTFCFVFSFVLALFHVFAGIVYKPPEYPDHDFSEAPKFTTLLSDRAATVGYTTKLLCSVRGSPKVWITSHEMHLCNSRVFVSFVIAILRPIFCRWITLIITLLSYTSSIEFRIIWAIMTCCRMRAGFKILRLNQPLACICCLLFWVAAAMDKLIFALVRLTQDT